MKYWYQKPNGSLSGYIRTVLILEGFSQPGTPQLPLFTNGMPTLFCRSEKDAEGNEKVLQLQLFGKSAPPECWTVNDNDTLIAYFFNPFALPCLFNIHAAKLVVAPVDLGAWSPHKIRALQTQLVYSATTQQKIEALDHLLIHQLEQNKRECEIIRYATDQIMCDSSAEILSTLLRQLNLTERTFQRIFKKYVGVSPGQFRRICQFQLSFDQLNNHNFDKLTDIAYENGFADQSHFTRSFREFTQITPRDYLRKGLKGKNR